MIEKLERELAENCRLNNWDLGFKAAIDIVKRYNEWVNVDDCLPGEGVTTFIDCMVGGEIKLDGGDK